MYYFVVRILLSFVRKISFFYLKLYDRIFHYNTKQHNRLLLGFILINNLHTSNEKIIC